MSLTCYTSCVENNKLVIKHESFAVSTHEQANSIVKSFRQNMPKDRTWLGKMIKRPL